MTKPERRAPKSSGSPASRTSRDARSRGVAPRGSRAPAHGQREAPKPSDQADRAGPTPVPTGPGRAKAERREVEFDVMVPPIAPTAEFTELSTGFGLNFEEGELGALGRYLAMLLEANRHFNLTSVTETGEAWKKHLFDSLTLLAVLGDLPEGATVADVGSGGGLPGIPLAIALPNLRFTLFEATGKKAQFLKIVARELGLNNVTVEQLRAEDAGQQHKVFRERFDAVTARALGRLNVAAELTAPLARIGGTIVLTKGEKAEEELAEAKPALNLLGARHAGTIDTPTGKLVVLEKVKATARDYPRRAGEPKRRPLV